MRKTTLIWLLAAFLGAVLLALLAPKEYRFVSHQKAAKELSQSLEAGDWGAIADYIPESDFKDAGISKENFAALCKGWLSKQLGEKPKVQARLDEYMSYVVIGEGRKRLEIALTRFPHITRASWSWGIHLTATQVAAVRAMQAQPDLRGKARIAAINRRVKDVLEETKAFGLTKLPPRPAYFGPVLSSPKKFARVTQ